MAKGYNRKDSLYLQAKEDGYRSRASYKLLELQKRFKLISKNHHVLDLGAWPGGWMQVVSEIVGAEGLLVGVDLQQIESLGQENIHCLCGDFNSPEILEDIKKLSNQGYHAVISDASPKLTGINATDQSITAECAKATYLIAEKFLKPGGTYVCKIFKGSETDQFVKSIKSKFRQFSRIELESSRNSSSETYVVGKGYHGT